MLIDEGTTVGVWAQKWLDVYCKNAMGEGCYQNYAGIVKNQIAPRIGALKLKDVRPIHCQERAQRRDWPLHLFLVQNPSCHVPDVQIRETRRRDRHQPRR